MSEEKEYITLTFEEDGAEEEAEYEVMGVVDVKDKQYIVLIPETDKESIEIYGLKEIPGDDESEEITMIESDKEYDLVIEELRKRGVNIELEN